MGTIWARQDPGGLHVGPMNYAIWVVSRMVCEVFCSELYASLTCYQLYINPLLNTKLIMFHGQWKYSIDIMVRISMTNLAEIYNCTISPKLFMNASPTWNRHAITPGNVRELYLNDQ